MLAYDSGTAQPPVTEHHFIRAPAPPMRQVDATRIVGQSPMLSQALRQVRQVARTDATVLVCGETGTGKELIAQAVHEASPRCDAPLVKVNCAAISAGLVESELFGHEKGSFTGAVKCHTGRFEVAHGGTLFLDEIGELPLDTQVKLLRVLQEGEFERVGSNQPIQVDVRIIAATNRNLHERVKAGEFRADLLYRLNVFPIQVPALRERADDIPLLVEHFLAKLSRRLNKPLDGITRSAMAELKRHAWPGNIRELQNVIERAAIVADGAVIDVDDLDLLPASDMVPGATADWTPTTLDDMARRHIIAALEQTNWMVSGKGGAAELLDINPNTLRSRMKKLGIQRAACIA